MVVTYEKTDESETGPFSVLHHYGHPEKEDHYDLIFGIGTEAVKYETQDDNYHEEFSAERFHRTVCDDYLTLDAPKEMSGNRGIVEQIRWGRWVKIRDSLEILLDNGMCYSVSPADLEAREIKITKMKQ